MYTVMTLSSQTELNAEEKSTGVLQATTLLPYVFDVMIGTLSISSVHLLG